MSLCATAAGLWYVRGADASSSVVANAPTNLPIVARPPAQQPQIGLPSDSHLDKTPPRRTVGLDLVRNGWTYNCMECHKLFPAKWHYDRPLNEHKGIRLEHGNNRFCLNCHHPANRNAFVDYDGGEIAQADVVVLCAKCHGTIYRDWQAGVHGRPNGFWNAQMGDKTKLRCIQCHDPHGSPTNLFAIRTQFYLGALPTRFHSMRLQNTTISFTLLNPSNLENLCISCHQDPANPGFPMTNHDGGEIHNGGNDYTNMNCTFCHYHDFDGDSTTKDGFMPALPMAVTIVAKNSPTPVTTPTPASTQAVTATFTPTPAETHTPAPTATATAAP